MDISTHVVMKSIFIKTNSLNTDLAALMLRLIFGGLFIYHGFSKLSSFNDTLSHFTDIIGIGTKLSLILVIFAEFFCGIFVTIGFLTRISVFPIFITMTVAFFIAHADDPFRSKELSLLFWLLSYVIFILGSGKFSIDRFIFNNRNNN